MVVSARAVEHAPTAPAPAPAPTGAEAVRISLRNIRARKREIRAAQADDASTDDAVITCEGCSEVLHPHPDIRGKYVCERVARRYREVPIATGVTVITDERVQVLTCRCRTATTPDDECNCERVPAKVTGIDLDLPDSVSAVRMAQRITREDGQRADRIAGEHLEYHLRGYGVVVMCEMPCKAQEHRTRVDKRPASERGAQKGKPRTTEYMALAHKHERGQDGTFAVAIRTTAALGDLTGGRMDGETHYTRKWEAEQAYYDAKAWLGTLASREAVMAQKRIRREDRLITQVKRQVDARGAMSTNMGLAMARALERI